MKFSYDELVCLLHHMDGYTYEGAIRLAKYLFKREMDEGINLNIDIKAIKANWIEYISDSDIMNAYSNKIKIYGTSNENRLESLLHSLEDKTVVLISDKNSMNRNSYIVENF